MKNKYKPGDYITVDAPIDKSGTDEDSNFLCIYVGVDSVGYHVVEHLFTEDGYEPLYLYDGYSLESLKEAPEDLIKKYYDTKGWEYK